jgi:hypothetical protein
MPSKKSYKERKGPSPARKDFSDDDEKKTKSHEVSPGPLTLVQSGKFCFSYINDN